MRFRALQVSGLNPGLNKIERDQGSFGPAEFQTCVNPFWTVNYEAFDYINFYVGQSFTLKILS